MGKWQEVNYEPDFLHGFTDHKFGTKETEQIKITYAGNDQYGSFSSDEITVTIVDPRSVSVLELNAGVTLQYNTEETMKQEIYEKVIASLNTGEELRLHIQSMTSQSNLKERLENRQ